MSEGDLHVIFGTGQVGLALADRLTGLDVTVRAVSRHRPVTLAECVDWRAADATDLDAVSGAAKGGRPERLSVTEVNREACDQYSAQAH